MTLDTTEIIDFLPGEIEGQNIQLAAVDVIAEILRKSDTTYGNSCRFQVKARVGRWVVLGATCVGVGLHFLGFSGGPAGALFSGPVGLTTAGIVHFLAHLENSIQARTLEGGIVANLEHHRKLIREPIPGQWAYSTSDTEQTDGARGVSTSRVDLITYVPLAEGAVAKTVVIHRSEQP